jgi:hypothetical protein
MAFLSGLRRQSLLRGQALPHWQHRGRSSLRRSADCSRVPMALDTSRSLAGGPAAAFPSICKGLVWGFVKRPAPPKRRCYFNSRFLTASKNIGAPPSG